MRLKSRVDKNQPEILNHLKNLGIKYRALHFVGKGFPDLIVGFRGKNYLFEIKSKNGEKTKKEEEFFSSWDGQVKEVRHIDEILKEIGAT